MGVDWNKPLRRKVGKVKVESFHIIPDEFCFCENSSSSVRVKFVDEKEIKTYAKSGEYLGGASPLDLENYEPDIEVWVNVFRRPDGSLYPVAAPDADESEKQRLTKPVCYVCIGRTKTTVSVE